MHTLFSVRISSAVMFCALSVAGCTGAGPVATQPPLPQSSSSSSSISTPVRISGLEADDVFSTTTVEEWVKQVDHVAIVKIAAEAELPVSETAKQRGEGLIGREVTAVVQQIVWSHPSAARELPGTFRFNAAGWAFTKGIESKYRLGFSNKSYLVTGHTYLIALRYMEWGCPGRMDPQDGGPVTYWGPFGTYGATPADGGLGTGEFEGRETTEAGARDPYPTFRKAMLGRTPEWVAETLTAALRSNPALTHTQGPIDCDGP